ncbi:CHC2 zinc finger domain-containing protein [Aquimarina muelleri]|uniref:CHC2 zinc finger domain-containing protein n=2 Tax=Aquimarina muelleri TaxID=279356 RepID=UPI00040115ED|nr:CHC2 zinc finger domain-containing protein [Aquimarina muelleri]
MEISEIKAQLSITDVLQYYGVELIKNKQCLCPFHDDKTPSMQVYTNTNTVYCFSGNCAKSGKSIDVIDFIMHKESVTKHQAIVKAKAMVVPPAATQPSITKKPVEGLSEVLLILKEQLPRSRNATAYLQTRGLIKLKAIGSNHRNGNDKIQYKYPHLKNCIVFPLQDAQNNTVSFYGRSFKNELRNKHFYTSNRKGLYPAYPDTTTKHLILTESIIDAATLELHAKLPTHTAVLACYGTNGFTPEHAEAIHRLNLLQDIVLFFDGDEAGRTAATKLQSQLQKDYPNITIGVINTPKDEDINSLWINHEDSNIFTILLNESLKKIAQTQPKATPPKTKQVPQKNQLYYINNLIAQSGIIGEENSRLLLFIIASSYKTNKPLHAIVQGSSGSGKTHLISKIADVMPRENVLRFTRITESALYNFSEDMLVGKLIVIEDLDGLKEEALLAFRELVSNHQVSSGVSIKDKKGNIKSTTKIVKGIFSSMSATTKGAIYEDNMNRSFLLAVDESAAQSSKIIDYQNKRYAGEISSHSEHKAVEELQQIIRDLQNIPVINPYATQLELPNSVHKKRRLNEMFQSIIKQITFINQKQRTLKNGAIYTEIEDIEQAIEILFDSIILKIDELEGTQRVFYETLFKAFKNNPFTRFEAMAVTGLKKTQLQYHLNQLVQLEYLQQFGFSNRGFKYKIGFEDSITTIKKDLKKHFKNQLKILKETMPANATEHQRTPTERQTNTRIE